MNELYRSASHQLQRFGYKAVLLENDSKKPMFKNWTVPLSRASIDDWMRRRLCNIGILMTEGVAVVDLDNHSLEWGKERGIESPMISRTKRGFHLYFQHCLDPPKSRKFEGGDIKMTGFCGSPPATVSGWQYEWVTGILKREALLPLPLDLLREELRPETKPIILPTGDKALERVRTYVRKIVAESGKSGDRQTFRCACRLAEVLKDERLVLAELLAWNETNCFPKWTERELEHKAKCAMKFAR